MKKMGATVASFFRGHPRLSFLFTAIILAFLTVTFSNPVCSFIYPYFRTDDLVQDPNFFNLFGQLMLKGETPYVDIFDHKGLYIFWFYAFGNLLGGKPVLFLMEMLWFTCDFYFLFKIFDLFQPKYLPKLLLCLLFAAGFIAQSQGGSDEDIELPFVVVPLYFYLKAIFHNDDRSFMIGNILWGVEAGFCLNLRPSDCMFALGPILFFIIHEMKMKKPLLILRDAGLCVAALLLTIAPAFIAASVGGYFPQMFDAVYLSNFSYFGSAVVDPAGKTLVLILTCIGVAGAALLVWYLCRKINPTEWWFYAIALAFVGTFQILASLFTHYWIMAYPYLVLLIGRSLNVAAWPKKKGAQIGLTSGMLTLFVAVSALWPIYYYGQHLDAKDVSIRDYILQAIPDEAERSDGHVIGIDIESGVYTAAGVYPHYKDFAMQGWHSKFDEKLIPDMENYLIRAKDADGKYLIDAPLIDYVILNDASYDAGFSYRQPLRNFVEKDSGKFEIVGSVDDNPYLDIYRYIG
jgi:hypothetical protein